VCVCVWREKRHRAAGLGTKDRANQLPRANNRESHERIEGPRILARCQGLDVAPRITLPAFTKGRRELRAAPGSLRPASYPRICPPRLWRHRRLHSTKKFDLTARFCVRGLCSSLCIGFSLVYRTANVSTCQKHR
jgi:hypothetical protein